MSDRDEAVDCEPRPIATVLIADDDPYLRQTARIVLEANRYRVVEAGDGEAALRAMEDELPDVAVVDLVMPMADGQEVLRRVSEKWDSAPPIVVMTGYASVDTVVDLMKDGATDCLAKPFQEEDLLAKIERAVGLESFDDEGGPTAGRSVKLSRREIDVLLHMREGLTNREIAERMSLGRRTIDEYVRRICGKIGVTNRTSAVSWSYRYPLLDLKEPRNKP